MIKINGELFGNEEFHNGEVIYKGITSLSKDYNTITMEFSDNRDIANLMFAERYIREKSPNSAIKLIMLYIPYSRMDREIPEGNQLFSLKYFSQILKSLNIQEIEVLDAHSKVSEDLIPSILKVDITKYISNVIKDFKPDYVMFPDKGAKAKYTQIGSLTDLLNSMGIKCFYGTKKRDLANKGEIIADAYEIHDVDSSELMHKKVLIIDDIVSLGGTAYIAGSKLKSMGVDKVALYVSHCENGVFYGKLLNGDNRAVDTIYTAATTPLEKKHDNLVIVEKENK